MTKKKESKPEMIEDKDLDEASGGLGMLLPAVQKVRDTADPDSPTAAFDPGFLGGASVAGR